jgi:hypothetical protein
MARNPILRRLTDAMLFHPTRGQARTPAAFGVDYEELAVRGSDGVRTQAWWIPGDLNAPVVLMFHGNAGTIADRLENAMMIRELGVDLMMAEYRGYGDSQGRPSERGLYADARAALAEARDRAAGRPVIVFGRSLGGAVAIDLASREPVDGLIVESTFTSLRALARTTRIPFASRAVAYDFDSVSKIARVTAPILVIHGDADELVPFRMGRALSEAAAGSPDSRLHTVAGGDHNGTWLAGGSAYWAAWRQLIADVESAERSA